MKSRIKVDRISSLPKNVIDSILTRLPINEAVRTSILSRGWRYQWHFLSKIIFNSDDLGHLKRERAKIIYYILLFHCGLVDRFELGINLEKPNDIDRWILYLSRNGIKELIIMNPWNRRHYNVSSSLFSCSDLNYLKLIRCIIKPPPAAFKTFRNLTEMIFDDVVIAKKVLENVINSCPLLSRLTLNKVEPLPSLKINAPKLVMLQISGYIGCFQFMNTPLLESASFGLQYRSTSFNEDNNIVKFLGSMPILQRLKLTCAALRHLAVGDIPVCLPFVCPIKHLSVTINFEDLQALLYAFCIFRSSPFIQYLKTWFLSDKGLSRKSADGFWKGAHDFSFRFDHLQTVSVTSFEGTESEFKFIEFLLSKAPALKTMNIKFACRVENKRTTVAKLVQLPRISPKAELILAD